MPERARPTSRSPAWPSAARRRHLRLPGAPPPQYFQELSTVAFHPPAVQGHGERNQVYEDRQGLRHHNAAARRVRDGFDGVQRGQKADDRNISEYTAEYEEGLPVPSAGQGWVGRDVTCQGQYAPFDPGFSEAPVPQQRSVTEHDRIDLHRSEDGEQCVPQLMAHDADLHPDQKPKPDTTNPGHHSADHQQAYGEDERRSPFELSPSACHRALRFEFQ